MIIYICYNGFINCTVRSQFIRWSTKWYIVCLSVALGPKNKENIEVSKKTKFQQTFTLSLLTELYNITTNCIVQMRTFCKCRTFEVFLINEKRLLLGRK